MSKRLVKVAAELNVGTKTIVDFLTGNGFEVTDKPTAKISDEMYELLAKNFHKSMVIKEQAEQITIGTRVGSGKKEETKPKEVKIKPWEKPQLDDVEPKSLVNKGETPEKEENKVVENPIVETPKEEEAKEEESKIKGPKILGKIDLDKMDNKGRLHKKETPKEEVKEEVAAPIKEEKTVESKVETPKEEPPVKEEVKVVKEEEKPVKVEEKPVKEEVVEPIVQPVVNKGDEIDELDNRTTTPPLKGLKILGKIQIEDPRKKKKKKGKHVANEEKVVSEEKKVTTTPTTETSNDDKKKKRRKRTKIAKGVTPTVEGAGDKSVVKKPGHKKGKGKEISEKEVDNKLKETLANMQGGAGKKNQKHKSSRSSRDERKEQRKLREEEEDAVIEVLQVTEFISVSDLANLLEVSAADIITMCMNVGHFVSINQRLDAELISLIASEYDRKVEFISAEDQIDIEDEEEEDDPADLIPRAPIVTVMGHVDHGKTSLLDYIRSASVAEGEAGGITQHIGAYEVIVPNVGGRITFLDTPGHEAFTAMRARGAKVTDIAVIIIAADDSIMPQTREAISHAQAAGVPIVFAINKIDKDGANVDKIKQELASMNLLIEEWGGKYQSQDISAKKGLNIDLLLEKILLEAELLELKANPSRRAVGTVLEASLEKGRGYVTKILVQNGTLGIGDPIVVGQNSGRVKAMFNEQGKRVKEAGPSSPVLVLGLDGAPQAGEKLAVLESERDVKELANKRAQIIRQQQIRATRRITLDDITRRLKVGNFQELNLIVKGDMDGSVEALSDALQKLVTDQIQTNIIYKAVGPITESDVNLAAASDAIIIGFQVRPNPQARRLAEQEGIEIKTYSVIYDAIEEVKSALEGMLEPKQVEQTVGLVEIQEVFNITKVGTVAGCLVREGKITRNSYIRIVRNGIVVYPKKEGANGELSSLKRFKDSVSEVKFGTECGLTIKNFDDIKAGDEIEVYELIEVKQKL